jgi:hypothetical protein
MRKEASENLNLADSVALLIESLCHKIRTPLSVVSNDLKYFETTLGKEETSRSLRRIDEIKNILKECAEFLNISGNPLSALALCQDLGITLKDPSQCANLVIHDGEKIKLAAHYIKRLLTEFGLTTKSENVFEFNSDHEGIHLSALINKEIHEEAKELSVFRVLGMEGSPLSALACILLDGSTSQITISPENQTTAKLTIKLPR